MKNRIFLSIFFFVVCLAEAVSASDEYDLSDYGDCQSEVFLEVFERALCIPSFYKIQYNRDAFGSKISMVRPAIHDLVTVNYSGVGQVYIGNYSDLKSNDEYIKYYSEKIFHPSLLEGYSYFLDKSSMGRISIYFLHNERDFIVVVDSSMDRILYFTRQMGIKDEELEFFPGAKTGN